MPFHEDIELAVDEAPPELVAGQTFNAVGSNYQVRELGEVVAAALVKLGKPVALEPGSLPKIVRNYKCSGEKLRTRLDLKLATTPAMAVEELVFFRVLQP